MLADLLLVAMEMDTVGLDEGGDVPTDNCDEDEDKDEGEGMIGSLDLLIWREMR